MSVIRAFAEAAKTEFYRGLSNTDKGIMRALACCDRDALTASDYTLMGSLLTEMLEAEWRAIETGRTADRLLEKRARDLAEKHTVEELEAMLPTETVRPEMSDGRRRTGAAVHNEAVRHMWENSRHIRRAIELKEEAS